jgi:hypothetical protein
VIGEVAVAYTIVSHVCGINQVTNSVKRLAGNPVGPDLKHSAAGAACTVSILQNCPTTLIGTPLAV